MAIDQPRNTFSARWADPRRGCEDPSAAFWCRTYLTSRELALSKLALTSRDAG